MTERVTTERVDSLLDEIRSTTFTPDAKAAADEIVGVIESLAAKDARIAELEGALRSLVVACQSSPSREIGVGGMTVDQSLARKVYTAVPSVAVLDASAALNEGGDDA